MFEIFNHIYLFLLLLFELLISTYNLQALRDKKLKGQLAVREELYGKSAKAAVKIEKVSFFGLILLLVVNAVNSCTCQLSRNLSTEQPILIQVAFLFQFYNYGIIFVEIGRLACR